MRPSTLLLAAVILTGDFAVVALADSTADTAAVSPAQNAGIPSSGSTPPTVESEAAAPAQVETSSETTPPAAPEPVAPEPVASATAPQPAPAAPQVITAQIDPELALRLSLLEKTLLAQSQGQSAIYNETTRLLMFFGSACVAMGLIAMIAAVFLMNRTLASVSAITAQVAHGHTLPALPSGPSALVPAAGSSPGGFEKVQASGQRFQNRMTSLEQRLEELEHLAGHGSNEPATSPATTAVPAEDPVEPVIERRTVPLAAILVRKSETLLNLGKTAEAMAALDEAAQHDGDMSEVHLARGRVLEKMGRLGDALQSYDLAVTSDDRNTAALLMKAGVLNRQERFDEALTCYERALAVHRTNN